MKTSPAVDQFFAIDPDKGEIVLLNRVTTERTDERGRIIYAYYTYHGLYECHWANAENTISLKEIVSYAVAKNPPDSKKRLLWAFFEAMR